MNMFINKQRRPNLSRPSIQPASSSGAATPDPSASSASATFQQQRSKRKPVDQHEFLRSLIKDFVKLSHLETVRNKAQMAYDQNKKLQDDIGRWSEVEPDAPQASSANLSAVQEHEPLIRESLESATAQIAQLEAQILDKGTQMNANIDGLADLMASASLSPTNHAKSEGGGTVGSMLESADENHWTRAENKFNAGTFPESAPGWLKSELSHLHGAIKASKTRNDSLTNQVAELKNEVALLRSQLGHVSAKSSSSHYARTPSAGYGGGSRSVYLGQEPEAATTPKVASAGMDESSHGSWGAPAADASEWGTSTAADSWDAAAAQTQSGGGDAGWGAPPPPPPPAPAPAASTSTEPSGASPRTQHRPASSSAATPKPSSGAPAMQRKRSSGSGRVRTAEDLDLPSCDVNQSFADHPAQLETVRNIARKVTDFELRAYDSQYVSAHNDRRKGDIARCNSRIEDLRVRVKVVEEMLNIEPETEVIARQHSEGQLQQQQQQPQAGGSEPASSVTTTAGGHDTDMADALGHGQDQQQ